MASLQQNYQQKTHATYENISHWINYYGAIEVHGVMPQIVLPPEAHCPIPLQVPSPPPSQLIINVQPKQSCTNVVEQSLHSKNVKHSGQSSELKVSCGFETNIASTKKIAIVVRDI